MRRAAMLALGVCVEGCSEFMTPLMSEVWPIIELGLQDSDASVRKATCVAISCLCEWLEDECVPKHAVLVPVSVFMSNYLVFIFSPYLACRLGYHGPC